MILRLLSPRTNKGQFNSTRYINEVFLSVVHNLHDLRDHDTALAYHAELQTDMDIFESNITDPRVYNAKFAKYARRGKDPDSPHSIKLSQVLKLINISRL